MTNYAFFVNSSVPMDVCMQPVDFFVFIEKEIEKLRTENRFRTADTYVSALRSLRGFVGTPELSIENMTQQLVMEYEHWLKGRGIQRNSSSFYMRILRACYNKAIKSHNLPNLHPFQHVYTGVDKTNKRAIRLETLQQLKKLDLTRHPNEEWARDLFLFSFYTRGMSFVDMALLRPDNIRDGYLMYCRKKTSQHLRMRWERCMLDIVNRYNGMQGEYLLPILQCPGRKTPENPKEIQKLYDSALHKVNQQLKMLSAKLQLDNPLSTYVARHAWASIAQQKQIPLSIISASMGHQSEKTTRIYLENIDTEKLDKANKLILKDIL